MGHDFRKKRNGTRNSQLGCPTTAARVSRDMSHDNRRLPGFFVPHIRLERHDNDGKTKEEK